MFGVFKTWGTKNAPAAQKKFPAPQTASDEIDLSALIDAVRTRRRRIFGATALAFLGSVVFCNVVSQKYTTEARLLLENADTYYSRPDKDSSRNSSDLPIDPEAILSQIQVMSSRDLTRAVIRKLKLGSLPEFDPVINGVPAATRLLVLFGLMKNPMQITPEERVIESFNNKVSIFEVGKSRVISVEVSTHDPDIAAKIANSVAEEYLLRQADAKKQSTRAASEWLNQTIEPLRQKLAEAEGRVEAYRSKNNLFIGTNNNSLSSQLLSETNTQLSNAKALQADQQARADLIRQALLTGRIFDVSDVIKDDLIRRLGESRATLKALLASELRVYLPQHPRIKELQAQIADLETQIRIAAERTARSLENDSKAGAARLASLATEIEAQKKQASQANEDDVALKALERDAKTLRDQLEAYSAKANEAKAHESPNASPADARIVTVALAPSVSSFPKTVPIILIATIATLVVSTVLVVAAELLNSSSHKAPEPLPAEPENSDLKQSNAEFAGALGLSAQPVEKRGPDFKALIEKIETVVQRAPVPPERPRTPSSSQTGQTESARRGSILAIDTLADRARKLDRSGAGATILLCGAEKSIGVTTVSVGLGRRLAMTESAILLDHNAEHPQIAQLIEPLALGLSDVIDGKASFAEAIHRDPQSRLHLLPFGLSRQEILTPELLKSVIEALRRTYKFVLIDAGGIAIASESLIALADLGVLVGSDKVERAVIADAKVKLGKAGEFMVVQADPAEPVAAIPPANDADSWTGMPAAR